jgi:E3 ubiquitin-protein ligase HUWE1
LAQLPSHLKTLPRTWPFPRGDLYHWIPLLDRFDDVLTSVIERYGLNAGPQVTPFGRYILLDAAGVEATQGGNVDEALDSLGYGPEGDRELVEVILYFSQLLQEKCGNRSLYSSSDRLNDLLNTTSNNLLILTLRLTLLLAQRYHARQRNASATHFQQTLLAAHYNIDLDKVQKIASPFPRPTVFGKPPTAPTSPAVAAKGTEKVVQTRLDANDAMVLLRETDGWEEWGNIRAVYYPGVSEQDKPSETQPSEQPPQFQAPSTPTPLRRSATMPTPRLSRMSSNEESPSVYATTPSAKTVESARNSKSVEVSAISVASTPLETLLESKLHEVPAESKYDFLHRARVAQSLVKSQVTREQILSIRLLALTNLAYVYPETIMQQRILQQDSDQPKRLQLAYQLAELTHLAASGDISALRTTQTSALYALDALTKHKSRSADVCAALNVNVNHGILMFLTRKAIAELSNEQDDGDESDEWRDALLLLLRTLPGSSSRTPETLIAAGLIPIFVDVLNLRTEKARRVYPRVLEFLDTFVHAVRDALGTLASAKGFDAISDLIGSETKSAFENVNQELGIPAEYRTPSVDYDIPYFQQQSLRWLFRFVNHIMQHNGGGFDRLLRNLVDSPPLLTALRLVFENAKIFGSHVWSGAVNILSSFIHNEPTSYAVIAEAGLSKSLLEAITLQDLKLPEVESTAMTDETVSVNQPEAPSSTSLVARDQSYTLARSQDQQLARGILPASEAMSCIPQAFGAICLNSAGLELFQASGALESYFEIFESPVHVKCMDANLVRSLGTTFDELVRHHPALKKSVMSAVLVMVARVGLLCKKMAYNGAGAKLWASDAQGSLVVAGSKYGLFTEIGEPYEEIVKRDGQFYYPPLQETTLPSGASLNVGQVPDLSLRNAQSAPSDADEWGLTAANYIYPVMRFLGAFFENQVNCTHFIESGGVEFILDFATLPSLTFDFQSRQANNELAQLVHMMAETKPHLVIPSLVKRTQDSVDCLADFSKEPKQNGFFTSLARLEPGDAMDRETATEDEVLIKERGTYYVKHLVATHVLTDIIREIYTTPMYQTRPSQQTSAFSQVNLTEQYTNLVTSLGQLHAACVWDEILLQKNLPKRWIEATKVRDYDLGSEEAKDTAGSPSNIEPARPTSSGTTNAQEDGLSQSAPATSADEGAQFDEDHKPAFKNTQTLRYLLSSLPTTISGFFHLLGHGILGKRRPDILARQNASMVSDAIAQVVLRQLQLDAPNKSSDPKDRFSYLIVILSAFTQLLFEAPVERSHSHCLTAILFAFKRQNGLKALKNLGALFLQEINFLSSQVGGFDDSDKSARLASAYGGLKIILTFFSEVTSARESTQTQALLSSERERDRSDYFNPGQFLVDLRMEVLPMVRELWSSDFVDKASSSIVKCLVDILRSILDGEHENGAITQRSSSHQFCSDDPKKEFLLNQERVSTLVDRGFSLDLSSEALYRCNNTLVTADEYCQAQTWLRPPPRLRPEFDLQSTGRTNMSTEDTPVTDAPFNMSVTDTNYALARLFSEGSTRLVQGDRNLNSNLEREAGNNEILSRALNHIFSDSEPILNESSDEPPSQTHRRAPSESVAPSTELRRREITTIEDLDIERDKVRKNMIERCLDVLNVHHDVTFELADLIAAATKKHRDPEGFRKEVGETLVQSLISLQMEDDLQPSGKKIAAYANLLALVLQDRQIYTATLEELKECFVTLLGFIKIPISDKGPEESSPWVGQVLLVIEKLLSDDAQPPQIEWNLPQSFDDPIDPGPARLKPSLLSSDEKTQLFESILEILPRIGKDESLALSVSRILVILTRARNIAVRMGEKRNLQRLFVMLKQLSSSTGDKLQGAFMLILRHVVEDEETVRQIMRSEITAGFESRSSRQTDTTAYVRQMYHLVLRSPELFVEVTNEKLKIQRYDPHQRPQNLALKVSKTDTASEKEESTDKAVDSVENKEPTDTKDKGKAVELKPPVVGNPDGVIHYLLSELLSYRDVDDKDSTQDNAEGSTTNPPENQNDIELSVGDASPSSSIADLSTARDSKSQEKPTFKADDHPIYIYRCFLLQCLTELLSSYNRTKVEFINYSRKADPLAATPSKPRGGVLNYLLHTLVPTGTLEHDESVAFKKRSNTSACAMRVLVALCTRTGEFGGNSRRRNVEDEEEEEPELLFVRRFALEHALKAYRDAMSSTESLDMKYSRLMCLADLFDKMLSGYTFASGDTTFPSSTRQLAKTMFEKHFISALTASIADVDLNFPASKRVIKYILRPLNKLSRTAVILSETSSISTLGETEEDEISSATSVSDMDDDREETPDLFRHSTLGMLEPNHEEDTSEEESEEDDEMYDDEYGDEMDYDEDLPEDDGEVISDEDEDLDGRGPIEGLPGDSGMDIEVLLDEDEDDDSDEDDEDDEDSDMDDEDDDDEIMAGEITGDRDNDSLAGDEDDEWESEDMSEDNEEAAEMLNQLENEFADMRHGDQQGEGQRFGNLFRVIHEANGVDDFPANSIGGDPQEELMVDEMNGDEGEYVPPFFMAMLTVNLDEDEDEIDELEEELDEMDDDQISYDEGIDGNRYPFLVLFIVLTVKQMKIWSLGVGMVRNPLFHATITITITAISVECPQHGRAFLVASIVMASFRFRLIALNALRWLLEIPMTARIRS